MAISVNKNNGLTPLEKCQFFHFFNFLFLEPRKALFSFTNIVKHIFLAYIAKKKSWKNGHVLNKTIC